MWTEIGFLNENELIMRIGSRNLLDAYGSRIEVVRAWLRGELSDVDENYLDDVFGSSPIPAEELIAAAKAATYEPRERKPPDQLPIVDDRNY